MIEEDFSKYNGEGTELRKAQLRMLDILREVDKICRKHDIPYWIDYGTLLGAIRHGGFIPWDDDLDISMMQEDYKRFLAIAPQELPNHFVVQNSSTEKYFPLTYTKIVDKCSKTTSDDYSQQHREFNGLWIDIFPIIKGNVKFRRWIDPIYGRCYRRVHHFEPFNISVLIAFMLYPFVWIVKQLMKFFGLFCDKDLRMDEFGMTELLYRMQKHYSDYLPTKNIKFENILVPIPNHPEKVLTDYYGDYMQIPPIEKRVTHEMNIKFLE